MEILLKAILQRRMKQKLMIYAAFFWTTVEEIFASTTETPNWSVRFQVGSGLTYGTIEVYQDTEWKNMCRDGFDDSEATVVCRQMGFAGGRLWRNIPGTKTIDKKIYRCVGNEATLNNCIRTTGPTIRNCSHNEDVAVHCYNSDENPNITPREKMVRIVGGSAHDETPAGTVEVLSEGAWMAVCPDDWTKYEACTICHQLGYWGSGCKTQNDFGLSSGYDALFRSPSIMGIDCEGKIKNNVSECSTTKMYCTSHVSPHKTNFAGVQCAEPGNLEYRLVNDGYLYNLSYGTLEVFVSSNRYWHPICDNLASTSLYYNTSAEEACKTMGYHAGHSVFGSMFGWSRAHGNNYSPVREIDSGGAIMYGSCTTDHHLGAICYNNPSDVKTITVRPKPTTTKDPYYETKYGPEDEPKASTEKLIMYLAIAATIVGLLLLAGYLLKRAKCCKRRRETAAIDGDAAARPPVGMAKRGPVKGMVIIPSRNANGGPGAPPRSHMSTHVNQAFNPHMPNPLGPDTGTTRPSDDVYFATGPGLAPVPPVYHGQPQAPAYLPPWQRGLNGPGPSRPLSGHDLLLATPPGVPPLNPYHPPAYDSLYPEDTSPLPAPSPLAAAASGGPPQAPLPEKQPLQESQPPEPLGNKDQGHKPEQKDQLSPPEDQQDAEINSLNKDMEMILADDPIEPPLKSPKMSSAPPANLLNDQDELDRDLDDILGESVLESTVSDSPNPGASNAGVVPIPPGPNTQTSPPISEQQLSSADEASSGPKPLSDMEREKTLSMEELERMLLPDTPAPQQTTEL